MARLTSLCVKCFTLQNNRVGLTALAKLACHNRNEDIFAFVIFCFCTLSNFPLQRQERFPSVSTESSQVRTAVAYLYYVLKGQLANCLHFLPQSTYSSTEHIQIPSDFFQLFHWAMKIVSILK